jgi:hypothetical protein
MSGWALFLLERNFFMALMMGKMEEGRERGWSLFS